MTLIRFMTCAGHDPQDPLHPGLKLVGVYPVIGGWALMNLEQVAGKGQDCSSPLYVMLGKAHHITPRVHTAHLAGFSKEFMQP